MILSGDTCFDLSPSSNKHGSEKALFLLLLLMFSSPHSSDGLLVLEHSRKIYMAPGGVLNVIPMVGWVTCRLDRLPNSKSFSISLISEWTSWSDQAWDLRDIIISPLLSSWSFMEIHLSEPLCICFIWCATNSTGYLTADLLLGITAIFWHTRLLAWKSLPRYCSMMALAVFFTVSVWTRPVLVGPWWTSLRKL